jgi:phage protein D
MAHELLRIVFDGVEIPGFYDDLQVLEVELDDELAGMFRFTLALVPAPDGSFAYLDEALLEPWRRVVVVAGPAGAEQELISGFVTHVRPEFGDGLDDCWLHVWGMDESVRLDRVDVVRAWPNQRDSDIARYVFDTHGLIPRVTDTEVLHREEVSTIVQRETDMQMLRRLAARNGFECFVEGRTGWFRPPAVPTVSSVPVLAVLFGDETNVIRFSLEVDALAPSDVRMTQQKRLERGQVEVISATSTLPSMGARRIADYLPSGFPSASVRLEQVVTTDEKEMQRLCDALYDEGSWLLTGEGEVDGNDYGAVLIPRMLVTIKGVGRTYSGNYLVSRVTHVFGPDGYRQVFGVKRNALLPTGQEDFAGTGDSEAAVLATAVVLTELTG